MAKAAQIICLNDGTIYRTQAEAAEALGVHESTVGRAATGKTRTLNGKIYRRYTKDTPPTAEELEEMRRQASAEILGL